MRGRGTPPRTAKASSISISERIRIARGVPQAVVKVTSYSKGRESSRRHWSYISRRGTLPLETESGELLTDREQQRSALDGLSFDKRKNARDQVNIVASAPKGASPDAVRRAARAFAQEGFAGQHYVFVLHEDKGHPHVHFAVALRGKTKKLDPRKQDLYRWREQWAAKAREQGIDLACSPRAARGVGRKGQKLPIYHMQQRGVTPRVTHLAVKDAATAGADTPWETYARARNAAERQAYRQSANELRATAKKASVAEKQKLEKAAGELEQFAARMPVAKTRRQQLSEALSAHCKQQSPPTRKPDDRER
jgi:type IV secretion system T-DNA border endonuclease VirD2